MRLKGKSALVIGAASGFGAEIACAFAREGANVTILDLSGEGAIKVAGEACPAATAVNGDVTRRDNIDAAAVRHGRRLDVVVNNAGCTHCNKPSLEATAAEFEVDGGRAI